MRENGDMAHGQSSHILFITMTIIGLGTNGHRDQTDIFPLLPGRVHTGTMTNGVCSAAARGSALRLTIHSSILRIGKYFDLILENYFVKEIKCTIELDN